MRCVKYGLVLLFCMVLCCIRPVSSYAGQYVLDPDDYQDDHDVYAVSLASDSDAGIMLLSSYDDVYDGSISSTVVTYMRGIVSRFSPATHYVLFRQSQYVYRLVYGEDLEVLGSHFTGSGCMYVTYDTRYYKVSDGIEGDFDLNVSSYTVYTDLDSMYPVLYEGVTRNAGYSILFALVVLLLFDIIKAFFSSGRHTI